MWVELSPGMTENGFIYNASSKGMDGNPPIHDGNPFDTHSRMRTAAVHFAAMVFPELKHQHMHCIIHIRNLHDIAEQA
jgi:hypothetical protein